MIPSWRLSLVVALGISAAWGAFGATGPFGEKPASRQSLPGDNLPPFNMLDGHGRLVPMPRLEGPIHRSGGPPESTAEGPSLEVSNRMALAAVNACLRRGARVGVAVIDSAGEARAMLTADGADGSHVFVAMRKAIAALAFRLPSSQIGSRLAAKRASLAKVTPAMFIMGGAAPIFRGGRPIGAIGVSGAAGSPPGAQDEACAAAGLNAAGSLRPR